jgi:hypothetical protein
MGAGCWLEHFLSVDAFEDEVDTKVLKDSAWNFAKGCRFSPAEIKVCSWFVPLIILPK